jgi:chitinase
VKLRRLAVALLVSIVLVVLGGLLGMPGMAPASPVGPPARILAGYYPAWYPAPARLRDIDPHYGLVYLFAARPVGGSPGTTGAVYWTAPGNGRGAASHFNDDLQYLRKIQGRKVILSVGGDGNGMSFPDRAKSRTFIASIVALYQQFGGFDGLDWNTFQATQRPDTAEMIWISLELKRRFPGFIISAPPAPWNVADQRFCRDMLHAGALDYAAPQYYDGPNLADPDYVIANVDQWVALLGASHVVVGFGVNSAANFMSDTQAAATWRELRRRHPDLRGAFNWELETDERQGWPFARKIGPLVLQAASSN